MTGIDQDVAPADVRTTMGSFTTGVAIVTTEHDGQPHGMTLNSLTSVSLEPPLLLVCLVDDSRTASAIRGRGEFVVNILSKRQEWLSNRFARAGQDHFDGIDTVPTPRGLPSLPGGLATIECRTDQLVPAGDHVIAVGRILGTQIRDGTPLTFFRGRYHQTRDAGHEAPWMW